MIGSEWRFHWAPVTGHANLVLQAHVLAEVRAIRIGLEPGGMDAVSRELLIACLRIARE